ncbi:phenylalanine--tRNA ligase subunit beta [Ehrlichia ruminantium]|uniref:Phenylalanine--tRNA ligase beta subunit n=1 Tax=Ehrlichia ruminantium TaxID=779 RepID=A0AAE6UIL6_EHRRU|nr:phenylalanine--tRNA ligase subunit beta [Ehrlichia ruminantium]QGR02645.1 phenylalanine--tRNA ligase subunit beta [Ehrlichia ruminantium]QGR03565.1 phenylalanine--tRNA ligase subunit beta [Ehrlichia ruminantium]QGR04492.1 phenylalanine--tRNA ligase subunit beta [Ehrlichia ruminantium]
MRFTLSWLMQYLDTDASLDVIVSKLSDIGLEVDSVDYREHLQPFIVVQIVDVVPHHAADRLSICQVYDGNQVYQIVCGASNVKVGMKSVLACIGAVIPKNQVVIKVAKLRGVDSYGMLCSKDELGITENIDADSGIIELPETYNVGDNFFFCEPVVELNITPNRGDCLGVYGIARDLAASGIGKLKSVDFCNITFANTCISPVEICLEVQGIVKGIYIKGIRNCESPKWLKEWLFSCGIKSVSCVVDILNYIMLSFNRPLHVYDADKIVGKLIFKKADDEIEFSALNDKKYLLGKENIIAVDLGYNVHSVAGVIGSEYSKCFFDTENIFLECAWFNPVDVALSSRKIKLSTDSSYRFERFVDPGFIQNGLKLATKMILEYCGGSPSDIVGVQNYVNDSIHLNFSPDAVQKVGNVDISREKILKFLDDLGFVIGNNGNNILTMIPPSWRSDIKHSSDIVEEVLRLYGYDKICETPIPVSNIDSFDNLHDRLRSVLLAEGMTEVVTWSFTSMEFAKKLGYESDVMLIDNPVNSNMNLMRPSVLLNLLQVISENQAYGSSEIAIFEIGQIYNVSNVCSSNSYVVGGVRYGNNLPRNFYKTDRVVDIFDVKSDFLRILQEMNIDCDSIDLVRSTRSCLHPMKSADVYFNNILIGYFGELHPSIVHLYEIKRPIVCFEVFLYQITKVDLICREFVESRYQSVKRDFAFLISKNINIQRVIEVAKNTNVQLIESISIFDIYEGDNIGDGMLSVALSVTFRSLDHTLNDQEIKSASDLIIDAISRELKGVLRSC